MEEDKDKRKGVAHDKLGDGDEQAKWDNQKEVHYSGTE